MAKIIFFCGHAGTGKTTLAGRFLQHTVQYQLGHFCLLDKDTLYGRYSAAVMGALTGNPNDRDSPAYLNNLREPEYRGLLDTARENLGLGVTPVVVGPLSREVSQHLLADCRWLGVPPQTVIRIVWVYLEEAEARQRIMMRCNPNDEWKLAHWEQYHHRLIRPDPQQYPELIMFDNTAPSSADFDALACRLLAV